MLQVRVHGPGDARVDDVAEPEPGRADVVVRVAACGICGIGRRPRHRRSHRSRRRWRAHRNRELRNVIERAVALHDKPIATNYLTVLMKELTLASLLTHRFPLERFGEALEVLQGSKDCGKVLVTMP